MQSFRSRRPVGGQGFGNVGVYEHVFARAHGELDPADPRNATIQDLNLAPRDARGIVEYETEVEFLKPADMARGNGVLLFEVSNCGNKLAVDAFDAGVAGSIADRNALSSLGDGFLMRRGYMLVWWGWEMDVRPGWSRLLMPPVIAHSPDGSPVKGVMRSEIVTPVATSSVPTAISQQL